MLFFQHAICLGFPALIVRAWVVKFTVFAAVQVLATEKTAFAKSNCVTCRIFFAALETGQIHGISPQKILNTPQHKPALQARHNIVAHDTEAPFEIFLCPVGGKNFDHIKKTEQQKSK